MSSLDALAVAVIGTGHLGQHHARIYAALPHVRLVAVVDTDPARARLVADRYGARALTEYTTLLSQVDAVSVAVPTSLHYPIVKTCLEAGLHVLVEKPITATIAQAEELVELADRQKRILHVGHVERFNPVVDEIRPFIKNPRFIECHRLSPFQPRGTDVDVVRDLMIHDLDMVLSFRPGTVRQVQAAGLQVLSTHLDIVNARIEFDHGCVANLTASRISTGRLRKLRIFEPRQYCTVDYHTREAVIQRASADPRDGSRPSVETHRVRGGEEEPLRRELAAFVQTVRGEPATGVSGQEALMALKLAQYVIDAIPAKEGHPASAPSFAPLSSLPR